MDFRKDNLLSWNKKIINYITFCISFILILLKAFFDTLDLWQRYVNYDQFQEDETVSLLSSRLFTYYLIVLLEQSTIIVDPNTNYLF